MKFFAFIIFAVLLLFIDVTFNLDLGLKKKFDKFLSNYPNQYLNPSEKITFLLKTKEAISKFEKIEFNLNNEICDRDNEELDKLRFICIKPKEEKKEVYIKFGDFKKEIIITKEKDIYLLDLDLKSILKEASLELNNNIFKGNLNIVQKDEDLPIYKDTMSKFSIKVYDSRFHANVKNGLIFFDKPWNEFSNIYYSNKKLFVNYEIDNEKFYSYKPYFLTKELNVEQLFSIGQNNENIIIKDVLKIRDNSLEVLNYSKKLPNINLFKVRTDENKNGYIKFRISNMNKDNVFNLYMNTRHIFKYEYPNFKFDIRDIKENDNATERVLIGTQSFIQNFMAPNEKEAKFNKGIIKELYFLFEKTDNSCKLTVNADNYKKVSKEFLCGDDSLNEIINSQLHIENPKCTNNNDKKCVLFEISDLETGIDYSNSPTRDYKY